MKKTVLIYGLLAGVLCAGMLMFSLAGESINFDQGMYFGFASMILSAVIMWAGLASYKKNKLGGRISFGRALGAGTLMAFIASSMYVITWMAGYNNMFAGFTQKYTAYEIERIKNSGKNDAVVQKEVAEVQANMDMYDNNAGYRAAITYTEIFPIQFIIVLIASTVLTLTNKPKQQAPNWDFEGKQNK